MLKVVIAGGGFGGIRAALDLEAAKIRDLKIVLVSDKPHFEYHPALYRVVTGRSPLEVCIPLSEIFKGKGVEVLQDVIRGVNLKEKTLMGESGSRYEFDFLVLALGSETAYFNIPGLPELSYGFKSIAEALRLKRHLHEVFESCEKATSEAKVCAAHIVVVGGGASGVEAAGELATYAKKLAHQHKLDPSLVTVDLIEAASRLLPAMQEDVSAKVAERLRDLGVNLFLNRTVVKEEVERVYFKDMEIKTNTLIWTAGMKPHHLYAEIEGLELDKKGRVVVDELLQAKGFEDVFTIGDAAATPFVGMAQTAAHQGTYVAEAIFRKASGIPPVAYEPKQPSYAIPVGSGWATVVVGSVKIYGFLGWLIRRAADFRFFSSILAFPKAMLAWRNGKALCESCSICTPETIV